MNTQEQVSLAGKVLQAITSIALVLVGFIAVSAIDKLEKLDEKINTHLIASERRITALEYRTPK